MAKIESVNKPVEVIVNQKVYNLELTPEEFYVLRMLLGATGSDGYTPVGRVKSRLYSEFSKVMPYYPANNLVGNTVQGDFPEELKSN